MVQAPSASLSLLRIVDQLHIDAPQDPPDSFCKDNIMKLQGVRMSSKDIILAKAQARQLLCPMMDASIRELLCKTNLEGSQGDQRDAAEDIQENALGGLGQPIILAYSVVSISACMHNSR